MSVTEHDPQATRVRTYGGRRRTRDIGLFGFGPAASVVVLACLLTPLLAASISLQGGAAAAVPAAVAAGLTLTRVGGVSLAQLAQRRLRWAWGSAHGYPALRAGPAAATTGGQDHRASRTRHPRRPRRRRGAGKALRAAEQLATGGATDEDPAR